MIFAKNPETCTKFKNEIENKNAKKKYLARVYGNFDENKYKEINNDIVCVDKKNCKYEVFDNLSSEEKEKFKNIRKKSITFFKKIFYDKISNSSLLKVYPITGRTHQIRVHLNSINHPIWNDENYNGKYVGNNFYKNKKVNDLLKKDFKYEIENNFSEQEIEIFKKIKVDKFEKRDYSYEKINEIYLHSKNYKILGFNFKSEDPYWANKDCKINYKKID